jgi:hypothetical protein
MSSTAIRFGKLETITTDGITTVTEFESIHDYTPTVQLTKTTVNVFADNKKKVLAEILKLADKLNEDSVSEIAFECGKRNNGSPYKMSVSWVSK